MIDAKLGGQIYCGSYVIAMQTGQSKETLYEREGNGLPLYDNEGNFLGNYGVILPGVQVDPETGEVTSFEELSSFGTKKDIVKFRRIKKSRKSWHRHKRKFR